MCRAAGEPLAVEEIVVDPPKAYEVRIRIVCTSLCHSDLTFWRMKVGPLCPSRSLPAARPPLITASQVFACRISPAFSPEYLATKLSGECPRHTPCALAFRFHSNFVALVTLKILHTRTGITKH